MSEVRSKGVEAKNASVKLATISSSVKDSALEAMAQALEIKMNYII